jgi:hypothetical protein
MILLLTCDNCRMTSAVNPGFDKMEFPRQEAWIEWDVFVATKITAGKSRGDERNLTLR